VGQEGAAGPILRLSKSVRWSGKNQCPQSPCSPQHSVVQLPPGTRCGPTHIAHAGSGRWHRFVPLLRQADPHPAGARCLHSLDDWDPCRAWIHLPRLTPGSCPDIQFPGVPLARRPKRRASSTSRKRQPVPTPSRHPAPPRPPAEAEAEAAVGPEAAATAGPSSESRSLLPRRAPAPAAAANPPPSPPRGGPAGAAGQPAPEATASFLPRRDRVAGRAERQRQQAANLVPLEEGPAIPLDRTPYLRLDIRRVLTVCAFMVVMMIVGFVILH